PRPPRGRSRRGRGGGRAPRLPVGGRSADPRRRVRGLGGPHLALPLAPRRARRAGVCRQRLDRPAAGGSVNLAFFLTPKADVVWVPERATLRQALERMEFHRYSAVPLLDDDGRYVGTLTEGDLLWKIRSVAGFTWTDAERITIDGVPRRLEVHPVHVHVQIEELLNRT